MKNLLKNFLIFLIIFLVIAGVFSLTSSDSKKPQEISISQLVQEIQEDKVKEIVVTDNSLNILLVNQEKQLTLKEENQPLVELLTNYGVSSEKLSKLSIKVKTASNRNVFLTVILPILLPFLLLVGFFYYLSNQMKGSGMQAFKFGESKARQVNPKDKRTKVTFQNVAGVHEAKEALQDVVKFLKSPKNFINMGAKIPKGVLLIGLPGTGKTLLARAVAGEANVPFFHISGSEFVEMFVGVGASRVRDLFRRAQKNLPCIIFIDELDAVGRIRGSGVGGSHDEREQTLNQILVELDGFEPNSGLVVMAATNRPDILDPALLRPGRFDRKVILDIPDIKDREFILKIHSAGKPLASNVNLHQIAERTPGFSGADLENLLNEAAILTVKNNKKKVGHEEILESIDKVLLGPERKSHILSDKEKNIVAFHEAGHAIVSWNLPSCDPVHKVSIISRGQAAGYTLRMPEEEKYLRSKPEFLDNIAVYLGGYISEKLTFKEVTTGASNDLRQVTHLSRKLVTEFGMSDILGPRTFGEKEELIFLGREISERRDYSEKIAQTIDEEVSKIINLCYNRAEEILEKNKEKLEEVAKILLKKETIEKEEFAKIMKN